MKSINFIAPRTLFSVISLIGTTNSLAAHDYSNEVHSHPEDLLRLSDNIGGDVSDAVINAFKLWDTGSTIEFCFIDGSNPARLFFTDAAELWDSAIEGLSFDFGSTSSGNSCASNKAYDIRVSFQQPGNWSYIGTDATRADSSKPTLNIGTMPASGPSNAMSNSLRGTVLHEIGHAIGLSHEHQSPSSNCASEINWDFVYTELAGAPNNWSADKVDRNLRPLTSSQRIRNTEYDPDSIMHYYFPARWFIDQSSATCATKRNQMLSQTDIAAARWAYPSERENQMEYFENLLAQLNDEFQSKGIDKDEIARIISMVENVIPNSVKESASFNISTGENGTAVTIGDVSISSQGNNNQSIGVNLGTIGGD